MILEHACCLQRLYIFCSPSAVVGEDSLLYSCVRTHLLTSNAMNEILCKDVTLSMDAILSYNLLSCSITHPRIHTPVTARSNTLPHTTIGNKALLRLWLQIFHHHMNQF